MIYIPIIQYKYTVVTEPDTIFQEYYIVMKCKSMTYKKMYKYKKYKRCSRITIRDLENRAGRTGRKELQTVYHQSTTLPLRNSDQ